MEYKNEPHFIIKKNLQKSKNTGVYFSDIVTLEVLKDICFRITGQINFTYTYVDDDYSDMFLEKGYNKGRMALMFYQDIVNYISFSEKKIVGRNSSVQSVPTAYNIFFNNPYPKKRLYYYFLNTTGNAQTEYQIFIYRLMNTIGFEFLNVSCDLLGRISPFYSVDDIIFQRKVNSDKNKSNHSTFITKGSSGEIEVYGKTYGANKYETSLLCYALAKLWKYDSKIKVYEVLEGDLKELPKSSLQVMEQMGNFDIIPTDMKFEKIIYDGETNLRSPRYVLNLANKLGNKHCVLCNCEIPQLIEAAHIWPVASIKRFPNLSLEQRLEYALDGENGVWLCENHHKMFDEHMIEFDLNGQVVFGNNIDRRYMDFIEEITTCRTLSNEVVTKEFQWYLCQRYKISIEQL